MPSSFHRASLSAMQKNFKYKKADAVELYLCVEHLGQLGFQIDAFLLLNIFFYRVVT